MTITADIGLPVRARDYGCGINTYTMDIVVNDRGASYKAGNVGGLPGVAGPCVPQQ